MRPYLRAANVTWDGLALDDVKEMHFEPSESEKYQLRSGDILLNEASGSASEVGKSAIWRDQIEACYFQNTLLRVRSTGLMPEYLYWYFQHAVRRGVFADLAQGINIRHLGKSRLARLPVPVPPPSVQAQIVSAIDDRLLHLNIAIKALESAQRRVNSLSSAVAASLLDQPTWEWTTFGQIADIRAGITKDTQSESDRTFIEVPYLRVANVQRCYLDLSRVSTIRADPAKVDVLRLETGDILLTEGGDRDKLGRGWVWEGQIDRCIHQNHVFRARLRDHNMNPYFLSMHANTWGRSWFESHSRQTTNLASISMSTLRRFPVPMPPLEEQDTISRALTTAWADERRLRDSLDVAEKRSESLRRAILSAAFAGELSSTAELNADRSKLLDQAVIRRNRRSSSRPASPLDTKQ